MKLFYATAMALVVGAASYMLWTTFEPTVSAGTTSGSDDTALVKVILPDSFSDKAKVGQVGPSKTNQSQLCRGNAEDRT